MFWLSVDINGWKLNSEADNMLSIYRNNTIAFIKTNPLDKLDYLFCSTTFSFTISLFTYKSTFKSILSPRVNYFSI